MDWNVKYNVHKVTRYAYDVYHQRRHLNDVDRIKITSPSYSSSLVDHFFVIVG